MTRYLPEENHLEAARQYFSEYPNEHEYQTDDGVDIVKASDGQLYVLVPLPAKDSPLHSFQSLAITPEQQWAILTWNRTLSRKDMQIAVQQISEHHGIIDVLNQYEADKLLAHNFFDTFPEAIKFHRNRRDVTYPDNQSVNMLIPKNSWHNRLQSNNSSSNKMTLAQWIDQHEGIEVVTSFSKNPVDGTIFPHGKNRGKGSFAHVFESVLPNGHRTVVKVVNLSTKAKKDNISFGSLYEIVNTECDTLRDIGHIKAPEYWNHNHKTHYKYYLTIEDLGDNLYELMKFLEDTSYMLPTKTLFLVITSICHLYINYSFGRQTHSHRTLLQRDIKPENIMMSRSRKWAITDWGIVDRDKNNEKPEHKGTILYMAPTMFDDTATNEETEITALSRIFYFGKIFIARLNKKINSPSLIDFYPRKFIKCNFLKTLLSTSNLVRQNGHIFDLTTGQYQSKTLLALGARIAWVQFFDDLDFYVLDNNPTRQEAIFLLSLADIEPENVELMRLEEDHEKQYQAIILLGRFELHLLKAAQENLSTLTVADAITHIQQQAKTQDLKQRRQYDRLRQDKNHPDYYTRAILALSTLNEALIPMAWQTAIANDAHVLQKAIADLYLLGPVFTSTVVNSLELLYRQSDIGDELVPLAMSLILLGFPLKMEMVEEWIKQDNLKQLIINATFGPANYHEAIEEPTQMSQSLFYLQQADITSADPIWEVALDQNRRDLHHTIACIGQMPNSKQRLRQLISMERFIDCPITLAAKVILTDVLTAIIEGKTGDPIKKDFATSACSKIESYNLALPKEDMQNRVLSVTAIFSGHTGMFSRGKTKALLASENDLIGLTKLTSLPLYFYHQATQKESRLPPSIYSYEEYKYNYHSST